jgi:inner membrane protein involved in colicin E2 resistance
MLLVKSMELAGPRNMQVLASGKKKTHRQILADWSMSRFSEENVPEAQKADENEIGLGFAVDTSQSQPLLRSSC